MTGSSGVASLCEGATWARFLSLDGAAANAVARASCNAGSEDAAMFLGHVLENLNLDAMFDKVNSINSVFLMSDARNFLLKCCA